MKKFINFVDFNINSLLINNKDYKDQVSYLSNIKDLIKKPNDLVLLSDDIINKLLDYLVINDSIYVKERLKSIKINGFNDNDYLYVNNLFKDIMSRISYLEDMYNKKIINNMNLIERLYYIYSAFNNDIMAEEIVDFNLVNYLLNIMHVSNDYKDKIIKEISDNNIEIYKNKKIKSMNYYLNIDEYDLYYQYKNFINSKMKILNKVLSNNYNNVDYNIYNKCIGKLLDINKMLNEIEAGIELFSETKNVREKIILIDEKNILFNKIEELTEKYFDIEDYLLELIDNYEYIDDNVNSNIKPNIIYLTKEHDGNGDTVFSDYLKGIPFEYYGKVLKMLTDMENYSQYENLATNKVLTGVLKGMWEKKAFKVRIYYKKITNNDILILFCDMKKSNETSAKDRYASMLKNWNKEIKYIEEVMSEDSEKRNNLISVNKIIHENIKNKLVSKGRNM